MKKMIFMFAAVAAMCLAACSGNCDKSAGKVGKTDDKVYSGVLPAADADGVRYTLKLDYSDDHNYTTGDYDLVEVYLQSDTTSFIGYKDGAGFKSEGDFSVINGQGENSNTKYLKLVQDVKDSSAGSNAGPIYFRIDNDSTLTMVNAQLEAPTTPGYTLKLVR